jgi:hypothetical protein
MTATLPIVKSMFSVYLNQDFDLVFGTADDAIRAFVEYSDRNEVSRAIDEIRTMLAMTRSEDDLRKLILEELGSCYFYPAEWSSAERWLQHVLLLLDG